MANNFLSTEVTLANNSETDIISTTSNKQILIGFTAANKTTTSLTLTVKMNDGSSDFVIVNAVSIPPNSKIDRGGSLHCTVVRAGSTTML